MNDNIIFETLKELSKRESRRSNSQKVQPNNDRQTTKRKEPCYIYRDEQTKQIKEVALSKLDSAGAYINRTYKNPLKLIHDSIFGKY
jgi:hypothetical protein